MSRASEYRQRGVLMLTTSQFDDNDLSNSVARYGKAFAPIERIAILIRCG
jgi:hypothetical protein